MKGYNSTGIEGSDRFQAVPECSRGLIEVLRVCLRMGSRSGLMVRLANVYIWRMEGGSMTAFHGIVDGERKHASAAMV